MLLEIVCQAPTLLENLCSYYFTLGPLCLFTYTINMGRGTGILHASSLMLCPATALRLQLLLGPGTAL